MARRATGLGSRLATPMTFSASGLPCASIPTASSTESGPRPPVSSRSASGTLSTASRSMVSAPRARARASRSGDQVDDDDPLDALLVRRRDGELPDRTGAEHRQGAALGHVGVHHALPGGGQDVREVEEPLVVDVGVVSGDDDRPEVGVRHPHQLGLTAGHLAVERGVAEEARALALVAVLGRLALGEQPSGAHPAGAAGDVEGHHDPVAHRRGSPPPRRPPPPRP